jgi:putative peptide zinc metalloprotease protein
VESVLDQAARRAAADGAFLSLMAKPSECLMPSQDAQTYAVIPLSIQKDDNSYLVGNADSGDFYQFPEVAVRVLDMLRLGDSAPAIRAQLLAEAGETFDVDGFVEQLTAIGFVHPVGHPPSPQPAALQDSRRIFNVDPRFARAVFAWPMLCGYLAIMAYALGCAVLDPRLRLNPNAFYADANRTPLLLLILALSFVQVCLHESGHMLAAARHGVRSRYGIGNRLWMVVAESDLSGILALPKGQRYFPMLAGLLVDLLCAALLTLTLGTLLRAGAGGFTIQLVQAVILQIFIGVTWQFNIFVKTDVYFVLCNYFSHPDLDRDARRYLRGLLYRATRGRLGDPPAIAQPRGLQGLRVFAAIWLFGRIGSLFILFGMFLPTMAQYVQSALRLLRGPPAAFWMACDTIAYVAIMLTMLSAGMYLWLTQKQV